MSYESYAKRVLSVERAEKQNFGCVIVGHRGHVEAIGTNSLSAEPSPSCSMHAEMATIFKHLHTLGLWHRFQKALRKSYKHLGILTRVQGKGREPTTFG